MGHVHPPNREATRAVRLYSKPTMTVALVPCSPDVCTETLPLPPTARRGHRRAWEAGMEQDQTQCEAVPVPLSQTMQPWFGCKQPVPLCGCPGNPQGFSVRAPMGNVPSVPPPPPSCLFLHCILPPGPVSSLGPSVSPRQILHHSLLPQPKRLGAAAVLVQAEPFPQPHSRTQLSSCTHTGDSSIIRQLRIRCFGESARCKDFAQV